MGGSRAEQDAWLAKFIVNPADYEDQTGGGSPRARGAQGAHEKTTGQGEFIGNKGVLVFDFAPGVAALTPNQERVLMSQQVKFSTRGARLSITGHSSADEDASVSQKRADAVAAFLRSDPKHAVPEDNIIETKGVGATKPIAPEGQKGQINEANRKRNRSVEVVMTTAGEFLGSDTVDVNADKVGKDAPASHEKASDAVGYADIAASIIAGVFEGTAIGFAAEFVGPAAMMAHVALAWEEARAAQQRIAYADGVRNCADAARDFIAKHHASVGYNDIESVAMPKIDAMTYFPADVDEATIAASTGVKNAVDAFNPAMRRTEEFVRKRLAAKGLKGEELQKVYDKIIDDMRSNVAYALADALKKQALEIRRG
jgi:outer membrane protein OmpA-like peptidoglycan-associated protein